MVPSHKHIWWLATKPHSTCCQSHILKYPRNIYPKNSLMYRASSMVSYVSPIHHLCFIPVFFTTSTSIPRIHKLLKLPHINLSDAMTHAHSTTFPHVLCVIRSIFFWDYFTRSSWKCEANTMTLHAVPSQHPRLFPIFYTLWSSPTIQNTFLKLPQLNLCWNESIS